MSGFSAGGTQIATSFENRDEEMKILPPAAPGFVF